MKYPQRIIFMGTPEFAVASLEALCESGFNVVAVVTAPDKPAGRGMKASESAVKKYAVSRGLPVLQPEKLKSPEFLEALRALRADIQVVVAFRMLPEVVWNMPPMGSINIHGSLLPQYRGAAPINWAIINGEKETGVTSFQLQHEIDTGAMLLQDKIDIGENDNAGQIHDRMKEAGAKLLVKTLKGIFDGSISPVPQPPLPAEELKHAPKIHTETCRIDFTKSAIEVHNLIRGLSPYPGAFTRLGDKVLKIFSGRPVPENIADKPGTILSDNKTYLRFTCSDGYYEAKEIQLEGKKRMEVGEFLRGNNVVRNT